MLGGRLDMIALLVRLLALSIPNTCSSNTCKVVRLMSTVSMGLYIVTVSTCKSRVLYLETTCCAVVYVHSLKMTFTYSKWSNNLIVIYVLK